jgi:RNA polymerase sigma factor (TIGR02999 family)
MGARAGSGSGDDGSPPTREALSAESSEFQTILAAWRRGESGAVDELFTRLYDDLRLLARRQLARLRPGETLAPTVLVHELYARFAERSSPDLVDRGHFLALASRAMRHIVIDFHRRRHARRRDGGLAVPLDSGLAQQNAASPIDLIAIEDALNQLEALDARQAKVVELRFFGGLELDEIAAVLSVSERTIKRDWQKARAFLYHALH